MFAQMTFFIIMEHQAHACTYQRKCAAEQLRLWQTNSPNPCSNGQYYPPGIDNASKAQTPPHGAFQ